MRACKLPESFMVKIKQFTHTLRHEKSLWEGAEILENLPQSLNCEIHEYLESSQIKQQQNS
jgi:predicted metal-dependent hydrolase